MKILHIVGGSPNSGAYKGAEILHNALIKLGVKSKFLNDSTYIKNNSRIIFLKRNFFQNILYKINVSIEKILKTIFLHSPRSTFSFCLLGDDITKFQEYKDADIIHIHWLGEGFVSLKSLSKINKPVVWTMRDMWPFTGGSHYIMDFEKYEKSLLSKLIKNYKKKIFKKNFHFVAISNWLKSKASENNVLKDHKIERIYNNIDLEKFEQISKNQATSAFKINTKKKIILFGANNPQSKRKGWDIFLETLNLIDKSKYFILIFGNFWSQKQLDVIGIEYKCLGFVNDYKKLNLVYSSSDLFVSASIQEAFGKTWAESMACETPVVCFKNTACAEIIDHKKNGYIVDDLDAQKLKMGIDWVAERIIKRNSDNQEIRKKILNFDPKNIANKYINLYSEIIKKNF